MSRTKRKHKLRYYLVNIKLLSKRRTGENAYLEIFEDMFKKRIIKKTEGDHAMIFRTMHRRNFGNNIMLLGMITRFTSVEGDNWINIKNFEIEQPDIPKNYLPNPKEIMYYFVPSAHRFALKVDQSISLGAVVEFLKKALLEVIQQGEHIEVITEQASDVFEKILKAKSVKRLVITVTYTNADIEEGATEWLDDLLKDSQVGKTRLEFTSDHNENIIIENNKVIQGALGLAQNNGTVEARIVDSEDNKKKTIKTSLHPKSDEIEEILEDNLLPRLFNKIMDTYRRNGE